MRKLVLSLFVLGMLGAAGYGLYLYLMAPHQVFCTRLVQLCEVEDTDALKTCNQVLEGLAETEGEALRKAATCAVESDSCTGATGCIVGAGASIGLKELAPLLKTSGDLMDDFVKGMKKGAGDLLK